MRAVLAVWLALTVVMPAVHADEVLEIIYRWQDEQGRWHFSNQTPPPERKADVIRISVRYPEGPGGLRASEQRLLEEFRQADLVRAAQQ
ncbi:MAG: DUF4124 domain-containing protein [Pseudomonadota bacterium]|nr:DUF4124 domain-containing protein [Pseudomonadota bacterium]